MLGIIGFAYVGINTDVNLNKDTKVNEVTKELKPRKASRKANSFIVENNYNNPIAHWSQNEDLSFLQTEQEEENQEIANEIVDKFLQCMEMINRDLNQKEKKNESKTADMPQRETTIYQNDVL